MRLRSDRGHFLPLQVQRWFGDATDGERRLLDRAYPPVLDVGCGPARHTLALHERGVAALGIDVSPAAVRIALARGAPVVHGSVFDELPGEGTWGSALLLDGNVGIGGSPVRLLTRLRRAIRRGGQVLVEVDPPGMPTESFRATIEGARLGRWFPWAIVGADARGDLATVARRRRVERWAAEARWFGELRA
jgi:SAM-dependent methyltransferase